MEHWQFLIQKQGDAPKQNPPRGVREACPLGIGQSATKGDRSWRLLESRNVEIIEGRYRVVACSNLGNVDVEVEITHTSTLEVPPKRRIQVRSRRTNSEGLIPVIPYTYLKPGIWELRCSGKLMSDRGKRWQHSIQLQVLPKVAANEVERANNEELSVLTAELSQQEAIIEQPISPVWLKGETVEQILQNLIELALPASELLPEDDKTVEGSPVDTLAAPLAVKLEEEIYIARWGETLTINGHVEQKEATLDLNQTSNYERVYGGEIRIELHSPQDSEIIRRVRQSLPEKLIPFPIRCSIEIPADCESKLILGEISLYGVLTIGSQAVLLAKESFTITDVTELLATSAVFTKSEPLATCEAQKLSVPLDLKLFNLVKTPSTRSLALHPCPKKSLPPKLNRQSLCKPAGISPQLPRFAEHQNQMMSPAVSEPPLKSESSDTNSTATAVSYVISKGTAFPYLKRLKTSQDEIEVIKRYPPEMFDLPAPIESQQHTSEIDHEYAALSVTEDTQSQDALFVQLVTPSSSELITTSSPHISPLIRKWMHTQGYSLPEPINLQNQDDYTYIVPRQEQINQELDTHTPGNGNAENLQDTKIEEQIATHTQQDKQINSPSLPPSLSPSLPHSPPPSLSPSLPHSPPHEQISSTWLVQEIVVDDTSNEAETDTFKNQPSKQEKASVSNVLFYFPLEKEITEALPVPQLHLPSGEVVCGKSVRVRVQLAQVCPEVAVKLWVEDCQTRCLLEEPLWLTNLLPNSSGGLEETTQIIVPFGCLEIRLEAIALNTVTQQESDKVTIQRAVIPPDLPSVQLDELLDI